MSLRLSSSQSSHFVSLWGGLGIPGDEVPLTGDNGGSPLANDGISPASEYRIETVTPPSAGTLDVYPDTSYLFRDAPEGTYPWVYRLWEDSIDRDTATEYLVVGSPVVSFDAAPALPTFAGGIAVYPVVQTDAAIALPAFAGSILSGGALVSVDFVLPLPVFSGGAKVSPVVQSASIVALPAFSGSISTGGFSAWIDFTAPLPAFSGSITGYVPAGTTLSPQDILAIADAVYAKFVAEGYENHVADALLSRTWP